MEEDEALPSTFGELALAAVLPAEEERTLRGVARAAATPPPPRNVYEELRFVHTWNVTDTEYNVFHIASTAFAAVHGGMTHMSSIRIGCSPYFEGDSEVVRRYDVHLDISEVRHSSAIEILLLCVDVHGRDLIAPVRYRTPDTWRGATHNFPTLRVPSTCDFGQALTRAIVVPRLKAGELRIVTTMLVDKEWFEHEKREADDVQKPPSAPPGQLDFRFTLLHDKSLHDFTIICRDGRATYPKALLYASSTFFRDWFDARGYDAVEINQDDTMLACLRKMVSFMVTQTWHWDKNRELTFEEAGNILQLIDRFRVQRWNLAYTWVRNQLMRQTIAKKTNLDYVVRMLVFVREFCRLYEVEEMCFALIIDKHTKQFLLDYAREGSNAARNELHAKLTAEGQFPTSSILERLNKVREKTFHVQKYEKRVKA